MIEVPDHVLKNRVLWNVRAQEYTAAGERAWAQSTPTWGIWEVPESEVELLPKDLNGKRTIELGCGTAYVSSWLARRGARAIGIDNSLAQLATARRLQLKHSLYFPLIHGDAERMPCADATFDFAISEYGACLWADPQRWVAEAGRLLRPGGQLVFLTNSFLLTLCEPEEDGQAAMARLLRPAFGMKRIEWPGDQGVEFHLSHGDWIRLLRRSGFEVEDLVEIRPAAGALSRYRYVTLEWALQWPCEEVWKVRKRT
jgi:SAM-dependent methyltransferase